MGASDQIPLLSEEGWPINRWAPGWFQSKPCRMRLWNHPPHDLDFVAIVLPSLLRRAVCASNFKLTHCRQTELLDIRRLS